MVCLLAPNQMRMGSRKIKAMTENNSPIIRFNTVAFPNVLMASGYRCSPIRMETIAAAPAPTNVPKAIAKFMMGKVMANPEMA